MKKRTYESAEQMKKRTYESAEKMKKRTYESVEKMKRTYESAQCANANKHNAHMHTKTSKFGCRLVHRCSMGTKQARE
jgi:hypothetical protein